MSKEPFRVVVLLGPTAVGKTSLVEDLAGYPFEVINADAMQVYRLMDIGTAKPSVELRRKIAHHLLDIRYPDEVFTVGDFVEATDVLVRTIHARGNIPLIVGGSGFYLWHFLYGLPPTPKISGAVRKKVQAMMSDTTAEERWQYLQDCDPASAVRIAKNDRYRISRAIEVYLESGRPLSSFPRPSTPRSEYECLIIGLHRSRQELKKRIRGRCEKMFQVGLVKEVQMLMDSGYTIDDPGIKAIGYREFWQHQTMPPDISAVQSEIVVHSCAYVKRQYTYFSKIPMVKWHAADNRADIGSQIISWNHNHATTNLVKN